MKYVYRIINAIFGALVFVSAFFVNFIKIRLETSDNLADTISDLTGNQTSGVAVGEEFSIHRFINFMNGKDDLSYFLSNEKRLFLWPKEFYALNTRMITFLVCFAVILIIGLVMIIISCFSNKRLPALILGGVGIVSDIVMIKMFNSMAVDIYKGTVDVAGYIVDNIIGNGILATILGSAAKSAFQLALSLCGLQNAFLLIFIGIVVWTVIFYLADLGDPEAEKEKAAAKAAKEAKKAAKASKKAEKAKKAEST